MTGKIGEVVVVSMVLVAVSVSLAGNVALAQGRNRLVQKISSPAEPVGMSNLRVSGREVNFDQEFLEDDGWVGTITFDVTNTSSKVITHFRISALVTDPAKPDRDIDIALGVHGVNTAIGGIAPTVSLQPGDVVHCTVASAVAALYGKLPQQRPALDSCDSLKVFVNEVIFADDTMWHKGVVLRRDPTNPMRWIRPRGESSLRQSNTGYRLAPASYSRVASDGGVCGEVDLIDWVWCGCCCYREVVWLVTGNPRWKYVPRQIICYSGLGEPCDVFDGSEEVFC